MNWKAYDEVNFSDQYILRWVREGDEYVNRITKEMMEDFKAIVRQQQAEIEALKKDNKELHAIAQRMAMAESDARKSLQWFKDAKERQNEPVAWMDYKGYLLDSEDVENYPKEGLVRIPLYTHPVDAVNTSKQYVDKTKKNRHDLTDEEILELWDWDSGEILATDLLDFADAILRKAQEK